MFVSEFNQRLSDIDRDILSYINKRMFEVGQELRQYVLDTCKYKIGNKFRHDKFGLLEIIEIDIRLNKDEALCTFENYMNPIYGIDYYNPYYMYRVNNNGKCLSLTQFDLDDGGILIHE